MGLLPAIELALMLAKGVVQAYTKKGIAGQILEDAQAAVKALEAVRGQQVTKPQLESLRIEPKW